MGIWSQARDVYLGLLDERSAFSAENALKSLSEARADSALQESGEYGLQSQIRPPFGKQGVRRPAFGDHPDYAHLRGTDGKEFGSVVTLFVDIEGSTKLGVLYTPDTVYRIKNAIVRSAIETIQAFDGHVHRIMGDAVMAYFRDANRDDESCVIDAINCGSYLVQFVKEVVLPELSDDDVKHEFGIRIGIDYGPPEKVLWASYGYPGIEEVTATSFHVDAAAKLQQAAGRNNILIGQALRDYIDLPSAVWTTKKREKGGRVEACEYLKPNYRDGNGNRINYRQHLLKQHYYWPLLPIRDPEPISVGIRVVGESGHSVFPSCGRPVDKGEKLEFDVHVNQYVPDEAKVVFRVENNGKEAFEKDPNKGGAHTEKKEMESRPFFRQGVTHREDTAFRGLHYMHISVEGRRGEKVLPEQTYGIYIK